MSISNPTLAHVRSVYKGAQPRPARGALARKLRGALTRKLADIGEGSEICFLIRFADGSEYCNGDTACAFTITFRTRDAERRVVCLGHVGLLESYFDESVDIDGDIALAFRVGLDAGFDTASHAPLAVRSAWHEWRFSNRSLTHAKVNASSHYGLGQAFYRYWLDQTAMMYTCGYWLEGTASLEEAQRHKMDHVCRKVQLSQGETFVDIGCGWGGQLFHGWEHYGALGTGINTTTEQVGALRADIARRGLDQKISVIMCDFRAIPGQYDTMFSIGTLEHAGRDQLPDVIRAHAQCLKPGGLGVIQFIGHVGVFDTEYFIRRHIFPGGWIPSLARAIEEMERNGLEVLDVENLRRHYALTLDCWAERFDRNWEAIRALDPQRFNESFRRKWRTYLWSSAEMFRSKNSRTHLFQVTVSKGNVAHNYPMNRAALYRN